MCGIAGWVDWQRDLCQDREMAVIEKMTETLIPRGPDDQGIWAADHVLLGHRRLIVLDPLGGTQPMVKVHQGRTYVIVYNGEIYNYRELRSKLKSLGHDFVAANSDTEVLLHSYIEWGINCVHYLNGIFAFAIWDESRQHLLLVRDRLGVKPLFYRAGPDSLLFASEIKSILAHPEVPAQVDGEGLAEILVLGPARTPGTVYLRVSRKCCLDTACFVTGMACVPGRTGACRASPIWMMLMLPPKSCGNCWKISLCASCSQMCLSVLFCPEDWTPAS